MTSKHRGLALLLAIAGAVAVTPAGAVEQAAPPARTINLNTASASELEELPGVGESRAKAIVEAREKRGGFKSVDELEEVKGIGKAAVDKLRPLVTTGSRAGTTSR